MTEPRQMLGMLAPVERTVRRPLGEWCEALSDQWGDVRVALSAARRGGRAAHIPYQRLSSVVNAAALTCVLSGAVRRAAVLTGVSIRLLAAADTVSRGDGVRALLLQPSINRARLRRLYRRGNKGTRAIQELRDACRARARYRLAGVLFEPQDWMELRIDGVPISGFVEVATTVELLKAYLSVGDFDGLLRIARVGGASELGCLACQEAEIIAVEALNPREALRRIHACVGAQQGFIVPMLKVREASILLRLGRRPQARDLADALLAKLTGNAERPTLFRVRLLVALLGTLAETDKRAASAWLPAVAATARQLGDVPLMRELLAVADVGECASSKCQEQVETIRAMCEASGYGNGPPQHSGARLARDAVGTLSRAVEHDMRSELKGVPAPST